MDRVFENSSFGEVETVLGFSGYGSTVIALSPSDGGTQSRTILLVLAKDLCPSVCRAVAPKIARRLVFDVIRSVPSFSNLGNASIFELAKSLRCSNVMKGTCLIRQNSNMRRFVIVLGGIVTQKEKDGKKSVNLMRGSSFGSTSTTLTLSQFQYTATTNVQLAVIPSQNIASIIMNDRSRNRATSTTSSKISNEAARPLSPSAESTF